MVWVDQKAERHSLLPPKRRRIEYEMDAL
jgi:hypothetical protein